MFHNYQTKTNLISLSIPLKRTILSLIGVETMSLMEERTERHCELGRCEWLVMGGLLTNGRRYMDQPATIKILT